MKTITWTGVTPWDELIRDAEHEEVVVMRDGHAVALLMPFDDDDLEWYAREHHPGFLGPIVKARQQPANRHMKSDAALQTNLRLDCRAWCASRHAPRAAMTSATAAHHLASR